MGYIGEGGGDSEDLGWICCIEEAPRLEGVSPEDGAELVAGGTIEEFADGSVIAGVGNFTEASAPIGIGEGDEKPVAPWLTGMRVTVRSTMQVGVGIDSFTGWLRRG
jgi:hypothetical protein